MPLPTATDSLQLYELGAGGTGFGEVYAWRTTTGDAATATTTTTLPPPVSCAPSAVSGVLCACRRPEPAACAGQPLPAALAGRRERACSLVGDAAATTDGHLIRRRLRRAVSGLRRAAGLIARARTHGVSADCAAALAADLRDAMRRAQRELAAPAG